MHAQHNVLANSVLAHKQLSTRSMWTTTNVDTLSKLHLKCFESLKLYGCVECAMYQAEILHDKVVGL